MSTESAGEIKNLECSHSGSDELSYLQTRIEDKSNAHRKVNLIFDHTAFIHGIGNIQRWFNKKYVNSYFGANFTEDVDLSIMIPSYTLHEFEYSKRGHTMVAANARRAIKFIDDLMEDDSNDQEPKQEQEEEREMGKGKEEAPASRLHSNILLESEHESSISWEKCLQHQIRQPLVKDFPQFGNRNGLRKKPNEEFDYDGFETPLKPSSDINQNEEARIPNRIKYLIKACIKQNHNLYKSVQRGSLEYSELWKLVTEDPTSKIWATSFGIECLNINEAELLIFNTHDIYRPPTMDPRIWKQEAEEDKQFYKDLKGTIDSTSYSYDSLNMKTGKSFSSKDKKKKSETKSKNVNVDKAGNVKRENFYKINYAPRGTGTLWTPGKS